MEHIFERIEFSELDLFETFQETYLATINGATINEKFRGTSLNNISVKLA